MLDDTLPVATEAPLDAYSRAVADVADRVGPAVVRVESGGAGRRGGVGSGVVIAGDGLVLTNSHLVAGSPRVRLAFAEGGGAEARLLGDDPDTDLALLRAELPRGTPAATLGEVEPDGPAAAGGLRVGGADDLTRLLGADRIGRSVEVAFLRDGQIERRAVTPRERPA